MTHITYKEIKFTAPTYAIIEKANEIIHDYQRQGYTLMRLAAKQGYGRD